jgi:mitogen-activated protein kinase 1/3
MYKSLIIVLLIVPLHLYGWDIDGRLIEPIAKVGEGSFGEVYKGRDKHTDSFVAVKKTKIDLKNKLSLLQCLREAYVFKHTSFEHPGHPNLVRLLDVLKGEKVGGHLYFYFVYEFMDTDLCKLLATSQYLTNEHIQSFVYQMVTGLRYLHSAGIMHRDLKPANVLVNADCSLKICDLNMASISPEEKSKPVAVASSLGKRKRSRESVDGTSSPTQTQHVTTRWYRAPEIILLEPYTKAVDVWSLGCIFAELLGMQEGNVPDYVRRALFPGDTCFPMSSEKSTDYKLETDQLNVIFDVIGTPTLKDIKYVSNGAKLYLEKLIQKGMKPSKSLEGLWPGADPNALDLLHRMLTFNPKKRITLDEALEHPYMESLRDDYWEGLCPTTLRMPCTKDENLGALLKYQYKQIQSFAEQKRAGKLL